MCTVAQSLISQGRNEGIQLGRSEGMAQGMAKIEAIINNLRTMGIDEEIIKKATEKYTEQNK